MNDPIVHVVLDANTLAAWLLPKSTQSVELRERSKSLIEARTLAQWPSIRLYVPGIAAAETQAVLDKYRHCTWAGPIKKDRSRRATKSEYHSAMKKFGALVQSRLIERLEHPSDHVIATRLVSPVNAKYQYRRKRVSDKKDAPRPQVPQPMSGSDCLIVACAVSLGLRVGSQNVVIASADTRLVDIVKKLRRLKIAAAESLGLFEAAKQLGVAWTNQLYPICLNLRTAGPSSLDRAFQTWPLPTDPGKPVSSAKELETEHQAVLVDIYMAKKTAAHVGVDKLPYSRELDSIRAEMVRRSGLHLPNPLIYRLLSRWRKAGHFKGK